MVLISTTHSKLRSLVLPFLREEVGRHQDQPGKEALLDENLYDFGGTRYRLVVHRVVGEAAGDKPHGGTDQLCKRAVYSIELYTSVFGWAKIERAALSTLVSIFGKECVSSVAAQHSPDDSTADEGAGVDAAGRGFDFVVKINSNQLPDELDAETCADFLSQVRVLAVGAPIRSAFASLESNGNKVVDVSNATGGGDVVHLPLQKPTTRGYGGDCHVVTDTDRVTVIFTVDFDDEVDRALAKLYLQQFMEARRMVNHAPICDVRRGIAPPREIANVDKLGSATTDISGFISFTYEVQHVNTQEKKDKAVALMVTFLTYLDYHVKSSKTFMHMRMRRTKDDMLNILHSKVSNLR